MRGRRRLHLGVAPSWKNFLVAIPIGKLVLDQNPANHFAEVEQAAFAPSNLVPGIGLSPDKMLMGRIFSYHDAHLHRIGTNYQQLPVNAARCPVHSYSKDGAMRVVLREVYGGLAGETFREICTGVITKRSMW